MPKHTILIADDEPDILSMLQDFFMGKGYFVRTAADSAQAVAQAEKRPDIILLDVNMPGMDGLAVCERIRGHVSCPIVFLTANVEDADKVRGFASGGDDYITKPFSLAELEARVAAHLRRETRRGAGGRVRFDGALTIDYTNRSVSCHDETIALARREFYIIELLSQNAGQVFDKERMYETIWGYDSAGDSSVIAEHVRRVRAKFMRAGCESRIETVWGCGYKWKK